MKTKFTSGNLNEDFINRLSVGSDVLFCSASAFSGESEKGWRGWRCDSKSDVLVLFASDLMETVSFSSCRTEREAIQGCRTARVSTVRLARAQAVK